ncbi:ATP synthase F1 subunit delta [Mesohalobacter halotolerans]|jgi:F-type H+-transporting ATPase subunit delta|uniref:ATP synthase subunit delta n=1 Tax=Mesohalobacter halotolerans TaxID=1883405 RepID=A0A4U5TUP1_9FLAO|nr:ATP synthase F1 subunit delta [Mesohalobacter halotolerans]MBS3738363.1 ATP synthase F1 subunit delta [Psychroflexus sp.]NBC58676.1 ATP synthase F1 subunit delta [Bacteroidota bacterium]TKS57244.1 ATP synthase F1 subunit delta [Mesohalobacter halotolerans]
MGQRAAKRYAKAILDLAQEQKSVDQLLDDMLLIQNSITQNPELRSIFNSPVVKNKDKCAIAKAVFKDVDDMLHKLFDTLSENNRFNHLKWICQAYTTQYNTLHNIREAHISSAVRLDNSVIKALKEQIKNITGDEAKVTTALNEDLIGGFILNLNDLQYDASLSGKLNKLKRNLHTR